MKLKITRIIRNVEVQEPTKVQTKKTKKRPNSEVMASSGEVCRYFKAIH